ncbi:unnamed protein product [Rotaria sp. Silwood2]|nr:unnamed protein product [Rotaria sp. Silwood2]
MDFEAEFQRLHRPRRISSRIDEHNTNAHVFAKNLSSSTINNFVEIDAENLAKIVTGLDDSLLLFQEIKQLTPAITQCHNITSFRYYFHIT